MTSADNIKEELDLIKEEDINVLLNQPSDKEKMQAEIDNLHYKIEVKKYMEYWTKAQKEYSLKIAMNAPPEEIPFE